MRTALIACLALTGCATVQPATQADVLFRLTQVQEVYDKTCTEVQRLRAAGVNVEAGRQGCIKADEILDVADAAYRAGRIAQAGSDGQRALIFILAAQAVVASAGSVK